MHYYKFNVKSWVADTSHLLPEEEGIYLRLTNHYYDKEQSIPEDLIPTLRKLRLTAYRDMVDGILQEFFILVNGYWVHKYCDKTLNKYHKNAEKNRINGALGGRPPSEITHSEPSGIPVATQTEPTLVNQEPLTKNQEPLTNNQTTTTSSKPTVSTGNGQVPIQQIINKWNAFANEQGLPLVVKPTTTIKGQIRQRWKDIPSLDQWDNFFHAIKINDFLAGRSPPGMGRSKPFRSTLLWITKETNFAKIAAGEYD